MAVTPRFRPDLNATAPEAERLIEDLLAYHRAHDPEDHYGFSTQEIWEYRLETYGYGALFAAWCTVAIDD